MDTATAEPGGRLGNLVFATFVVGQVLVEAGINIALHSITTIQVPLDEDRLLDDGQLNWTIAVTPLAALAGCLLAAPAAPRLGARRLLALTQPVYAASSLLVGLGGRYVWLLAGRALMMAALAASEATVLGYVTEVVPPARRALFTAALSTLGFVSSSLALLLAPYLHWRRLFLAAGFGPAAVCLLGLAFIPSSPKWLLSHGHSEDEARRAIVHFRGTERDVDVEVARIRDSLRRHQHQETEEERWSAASRWRQLLRRDTLLPLLLAAVQLFFFIWTGGMAVSGITSYILTPVRLSISAYHSALLPTAFAAVFILPGSLLVERCGRLPLLRGSGLISALGCVIIAVYFFLPAELQGRLGGLVLAGAALTQLAHACIISPIAFVYVSELLPNRTRTLAANICLGFMYTNMFVMFKLYPLLRDSLGFGGTFLLHAAVSLLQVGFALWCLPETKGLHLEDIQRIFQPGDTGKPVPFKPGEMHAGGRNNPALEVDC